MRPFILTGSAHPALADELARELEAELASCVVQRFPDGEQDVELRAAVGGQPVFLVQPLGPGTGDHVLELLLLSDACRRAGAGSVTAVVPYVAFARQDRVAKEGRPLGAKVLADVLGTGRFARVIAVDLHSAVAGSCLEPPVAHLTAVPAMAEALRRGAQPDSVVVAPDLGAVKLAESYASILGCALAVVSKVRISPVHVRVASLVGEVAGKRPIIVDDMISTGTTVNAAVDALLAHGCRPEIVVAATHGLFVGGAAERLDRPEVVRVLASDSLPRASGAPARLEVIRLAPLLAEAIRRIGSWRALDELLAR